MALGVAVDLHALPLQQDRQVGRLLQFHDQHPCTDEVRRPGRHQHRVAGRHLQLVHRSDQGAGVVRTHPTGHLGGVHGLPESQPDDGSRFRLQDVPGLGLAV